MGVIARPSGGFINGQIADASAQVNPDIDTIYSEFNGNIDDTNIKVGANINLATKALAASILSGLLKVSTVDVTVNVSINASSSNTYDSGLLTTSGVVLAITKRKAGGGVSTNVPLAGALENFDFELYVDTSTSKIYVVVKNRSAINVNPNMVIRLYYVQVS